MTQHRTVWVSLIVAIPLLAWAVHRSSHDRGAQVALAGVGAFLVLAVALYAALACLSAEPAAPGSPNDLCTWRWDAFRCSAGCRPRVHLPLLQVVCTPM